MMKPSRFVIGAMALAGWLALDGNAGAKPERAVVEQLLMGIEYVPTAADLKRLGPGVDRVLLSIASDEKAFGLKRLRAVYALGVVRSPAGLEYLRALLVEKRDATYCLDLGMLKASLRSLGAYGPETAVDLMPFLDANGPEARMAAAQGLARGGSPYARAALDQRILAERDPEVRRVVTLAVAGLPKK